jgi:type IV pilus assembly protein PilC
LSTRIIIGATDLFRHYGFFIFIGIALLVTILIIVIKRVKKVRFFFDGLILRIPLTGSIAKNYNLTNTCRTLGILLKSGTSVTEALIITSDTTENLQYKKSFYDISRGVSKGKTISELIKLFPKLFPPMLGHMISIGEKSGNLSNTLIYLSEFYENEFDDLTKNLSSSIEPVLMVVMGVIVGFVAISIITPIYEITTNIKI